MSFPFKNFEEFSKAEGPIYSFLNVPWVTPVLLVLTTILFIWFMIVPFKIKH